MNSEPAINNITYFSNHLPLGTSELTFQLEAKSPIENSKLFIKILNEPRVTFIDVEENETNELEISLNLSPVLQTFQHTLKVKVKEESTDPTSVYFLFVLNNIEQLSCTSF